MKGNFIIPVLAILFAGLFASFAICTVRASATIYIRADGNVDPPTAPIASMDNMVYVFIGNTSESVVIERDNITVDGAGYAVRGAGTGNGITLTGRTNVTINNLTITTFDVGILLTDSSNSSVAGNEITSNNQGVIVNASSDIRISENNVHSNGGNGIDVYDSSDGTIQANNVTANGQTGISVRAGCFRNNLTGNNVAANPGVGIWLQGCTNSALHDNRVADNGDGIYLLGAFNNFLFGNVMEGNTYNFGVYGTDLSSFTHSIDTSNVVDGKPVYYLVGESNVVLSPDAYDSNVGFVGLVNCTNVTVEGLSPPNNVEGVLLASTNDSKITGNNLANHGAGIYLWSSSNNTLSANNVTNNGYGIVSVSSSDNTIIHNSLTNNPAQAYNEGSNNTWDESYPSGGNHWSDYNGTDTNSGPYQNETGSDGIGDSRYTIDTNNIDHYPLMGTFDSFNASLQQTVQTISNSTISNFTFNGTAISFNVSGQTGTAGFCRICIPTALIGDTFRVFVNGTEVTYTTLLFSNTTQKYLYFNYTQSTQEITIVPELPSYLTLALLTAGTLLPLMLHRRKHSPVAPV